MGLSPEIKKQYRSIGHGLKPVVTIAGKGLSESVVQELSRALDDHELIKVKLAVEDRQQRQSVLNELCETLGCELVQNIGKTALVFREAAQPKLRHSNVRRP